MTIHIDFAQARELLGQVILERGDAFVYHTTCRDHCTYWNTDTDEPDCGVGCVLRKAGVPPSTVEALDGLAVASIETLQRQGILTSHGILMDENAALYLQEFQTKQDSAYEWGQAQAEAEKWAEEQGLIANGELVTVE